MANNKSIKGLEKELAELKKKREEERKRKNLSKQIKSERFSQTKGGKVFNAIGDLGLSVGKKILTPPKNNSKVKSAVKKKAKKPMDINEVLRSLPQ